MINAASTHNNFVNDGFIRKVLIQPHFSCRTRTFLASTNIMMKMIMPSIKAFICVYVVNFVYNWLQPTMIPEDNSLCS